MGIVAKNIIVGGGGTVIEDSTRPPIPTLASLKQKAQKNASKPLEKQQVIIKETSVEDDVIQHVKRSSYLLDMVTYNDE
jgi:hypothetical protein